MSKYSNFVSNMNDNFYEASFEVFSTFFINKNFQGRKYVGKKSTYCSKFGLSDCFQHSSAKNKQLK